MEHAKDNAALLAPLLDAAAGGNAQDFAPLLLQAKAQMQPEEWREAAARALEAAIKGGHAAIAEDLLDAGAPAAARFAWTAAARAGNLEMLELLRKKSGSQPIGPESARVKEAFNAASAAGHREAAAWLLENFSGRFDANDIIAAAKRAIVLQDTDEALFLVKAAETSPDLRARERQIVKNTLMSHALESGALPVIDYLYGDTQHSYATMLAYAAKADNVASFAHVMEMARAAGHVFPAVDIETPLMMATDTGCRNVADYILDTVPVNIHVHNEGPLRNALDRHAQDGFALVEKLLRLGADPVYAQRRAAEKFPQDAGLAQKIAALAQELSQGAGEKFERHVLSLPREKLAQDDAALGASPLVFAAENRLLARLLEKHPLAAGDFRAQNGRGESVLQILERTEQVAEVFAPCLWAGRQAAAEEILSRLSEKTKKSFDAAAFLRETEVLTLRRKARAHPYRLKP